MAIMIEQPHSADVERNNEIVTDQEYYQHN